MDLRAGWDAAVHHGMRAYYLPAAAGAALAISAFLPWVMVDTARYGGVPDLAGLWILGLGIVAVVLASLSIWTRRNSRHPLLLVGLAALGIFFLSYKLMARVVAERAWAVAQARAIVDGGTAAVLPVPRIGAGIYVGLAAASVLVLFGLTIVVRRAANPYVAEDDDE